ncbi:uncharacterized protein LOC127251301 [Andrographis paniculata]|uniref:uncharacterized protein LOC127251301 n=1 Tax=Andrographis paniculata TaxID=175694 RepID=UPI0021E8342E|nr:uncharacterized protein LOC127251301 [Andrographis paniculata]
MEESNLANIPSYENRGRTGEEYSDIASLTPECYDATIKARLIRLVDTRFPRSNIRILKLLFIDAYGFILQGVVHEMNIPILLPKLHEGNVYSIHKMKMILSCLKMATIRAELYFWIKGNLAITNEDKLKVAMKEETTLLACGALVISVEGSRAIALHKKKKVEFIRSRIFSMPELLNIANSERINIANLRYQNVVKFYRVLARIKRVDGGKVCNILFDPSLYPIPLEIYNSTGTLALKLKYAHLNFMFRLDLPFVRNFMRQRNGKANFKEYLSTFIDRAYIFILPVTPIFDRPGSQSPVYRILYVDWCEKCAHVFIRSS